MVEKTGAETTSSSVGNMGGSAGARRRESKDGVAVLRPLRAGRRRPDVPQTQTRSLPPRRKVRDKLSQEDRVVLSQVGGPCSALEAQRVRNGLLDCSPREPPPWMRCWGGRGRAWDCACPPSSPRRGQPALAVPPGPRALRPSCRALCPQRGKLMAPFRAGPPSAPWRWWP